MKNIFIQSRIYFVGIILVIISAILHFFAQFITNGAEFAVFLVNYLLTAGYWLYMVFLALFRRKEKKIRFNFIFPALLLALISAYALNRSMNVFDASPVWFSVVLVLVSTACLALEYFEQMNKWLKTGTMFLVGVGILVFLYLAIYLTPIYPMSAVVFLALGLSLHSFVPLLFCLFIIIWIVKHLHKQTAAFIAFLSGIATVVVMVVVFSFQWANTVNQINKTYHATFIEDEVLLPSWVRVAQRIDKNAITNKILKVGLTYKDINIDSFDWWDLDFGNRFTEPKIHDPLVITASLFSEKLSLSQDEKIKILESIYDSRHQATERLWSDDELHTIYINSSVLLYPQHRIAYTEQVMAVCNAGQYEWNRGEAIYTFHLPEGSVATSLSLWINGQEEKAILTSKSKAENAYRTIVGVEQRDPSLVVWKEGNSLTVRIFPVTSKEERTFKIGITSPLKFKENNLVYEPIYFDGPEYSNAKSEISVKMMQSAEKVHYPKFLHETATGFATNKEVKYSPLWNISMDAPKLSNHAFCFTSTDSLKIRYAVDNIKNYPANITIERVYLDINNSWTKEDLDAVWEIVKDKDVRVFNGTKIEKVDKTKKDFWFDELKNLQFSLFPLHLISKPQNSLLISKSTSVSPNIEDLKDARFLDNLKQKMTPDKAILFYNLGENLSPYLKTMKEFRLLRYCSGSIENLDNSIRKGEFSLAQEDDNHIVINDANICISRNISEQSDNKSTDAPDHLMRLFAYNHILAEYSQSWNKEESPLTGSMVQEAAQAYVVSPVSSLVVLETKADYERFDIEDAENSLKNASKSSQPSTPIGDGIWILVVLAMSSSLLTRRKK
jgi:XrtN system VIT domain protein